MTAAPGCTPESELILAFARSNPDEASVTRARTALARGIDWDLLLRTAELQGVLPLVHGNIGRRCPAAMPQAHDDRGRRICLGIAQLNLRLARELWRLLGVFEERGIRAIPFKGPVVAAVAYRSLALRPFGDLDILVSDADLEPARALLTSLGYTEGYQDPGVEHHFVDETRQITVDLHERIASSYFPAPGDFDELWNRVKPVTLAGGAVRGLSTEDSAFALCIHLVKDCRVWKERLSQVCDVAELITAEPALPWDRVLSGARAVGGERMVLFALWLAHDLLGAPVPAAARRRLESDPHMARLGEIVRLRLLRQLDGSLDYLPHRAEVLVEDSRFHLALMERHRDKVRYVRDLLLNRLLRLVTPTHLDRQFLALPRRLDPVYYLVRPVRVARDRLRGAPHPRRVLDQVSAGADYRADSVAEHARNGE